jgi:hypothetical protein
MFFSVSENGYVTPNNPDDMPPVRQGERFDYRKYREMYE